MASLTKGQKVRLGVFVGTGMTVLVAATVLLAGRKLTETVDNYQIRYSNKAVSFSGLSVGSDVTYSGLKIGRVETLSVARDDVSIIEVGISVAGGTPIAADSTASLSSQGITGMKYVDISRGSAKAKLRKPGDRIPPGDSMMDSLTAQAQTIGGKLELLLANLQAMTGTEQQRSVQKVLDEAGGILADNRQTIAAILKNAEKVTSDLAAMSHGGVAVVERTARIAANLEVVSADLKHLSAPSGNVGQAIAKVAKLVDGLNMVVVRSQGDIDMTLRHLREAAADMRDFSQAVKDNPTLLMFSGEHANDGRIGK
ncbi:MAG: MCE family protein [Deltaproteobacteria bacterium]|nr:MCE family protein [Deltaproteobacteria bacterium]